jgi:hypothetical protein
MFAIVIVCGGIPSSYIGGFLGDYFESDKGGKKFYLKGYISGFGILTSCIFVATCFLI